MTKSNVVITVHSDDQTKRYFQGMVERLGNLRADACSQAKCRYCGRYGSLGSCAGCGAPNTPVRMQPIPLDGRQPVAFPAFDVVKR